MHSEKLYRFQTITIEGGSCVKEQDNKLKRHHQQPEDPQSKMSEVWKAASTTLSPVGLWSAWAMYQNYRTSTGTVRHAASFTRPRPRCNSHNPHPCSDKEMSWPKCSIIVLLIYNIFDAKEDLDIIKMIVISSFSQTENSSIIIVHSFFFNGMEVW